MRVGVIGLGVVGGAVYHGLSGLGHDVIGHDPRVGGHSLREALSVDVAFVCVPTPSKKDGGCDVSVVEDVVHRASYLGFSGVLVIKSTVEPGTTARLSSAYPVRLAFVPEFLRERSAREDFVLHHDVCVVGVDPGRDAEYDLIVKAHGRLPKSFARMTPTEAELSKYFSNLLNALRVVFANEFYEVCRRLGADYDVVREAMSRRPTVGDAYLSCGPGMRGFGGPCLPKDAEAFAALVRDLGLDLGIFDAIVRENRKFPVTVIEGTRS